MQFNAEWEEFFKRRRAGPAVKEVEEDKRE
jgi:hypothetical protein